MVLKVLYKFVDLFLQIELEALLIDNLEQFGIRLNCLTEEKLLLGELDLNLLATLEYFYLMHGLEFIHGLYLAQVEVLLLPILLVEVDILAKEALRMIKNFEVKIAYRKLAKFFLCLYQIFI